MKKLFTMLMSVALLATMVVGGTLAQENLTALKFWDSGQISFTQNIQTKNSIGETEVVPNYADEEKPLWNKNALPSVYTDSAITIVDNESKFSFSAAGNVIDYYVSVTNNGKEPIYVRTVFAFENTNGLADQLFFNRNENVREVEWSEVTNVEIDKKIYNLYVCTYKNAIEGETTSPYSLQQFCFDKNIKDFKLDHYQILVKSQAIQATNENEKQILAVDSNIKNLFGEITKDNHPWSAVASSTEETTINE